MTKPKPFKPDGYTSVSPYLVVDNASRTIEFLVRVFAAIPLRRIARPDGSVMDAEVRIDDTVVMLGDPNTGWPVVGAHVHVYVPDVDACYRRALDAGATSVQEPMRKDDEDKRGGVTDAGGTTWWISTKMA
jgi:PhnB protein